MGGALACSVPQMCTGRVELFGEKTPGEPFARFDGVSLKNATRVPAMMSAASRLAFRSQLSEASFAVGQDLMLVRF